MSDPDELVRLDALRQSGALSPDEFDAERAKLLGAVPPSAGSGSAQSNGAEAPSGEGSWQTSDGKYDLPESYPDYPAPLTPRETLVETNTRPPLAVMEQPTLAFATAPLASKIRPTSEGDR